VAIHTKRWTRLEYERLIDLGAFGPDERLELLAGQMVLREPQGRPSQICCHSGSVPATDASSLAAPPYSALQSTVANGPRELRNQNTSWQ
jgi:hypothetical protein